MRDDVEDMEVVSLSTGRHQQIATACTGWQHVRQSCTGLCPGYSEWWLRFGKTLH